MANAVSPGTRFRYRCLGPAELRGPAGRALPLRTRKHRALLYVLARKAGAPTSRDLLVELLWPDAGGPRAAKHSLTQSASLINKAFGADLIVAAGKDLITMREGVLTVDALDFEDHAANGRAEEAFALWGGDLLEGLWVRGAPTFERYLADERERLRRVLRSVLKNLIESRQRSGNWAGMKAAAEKLLEVDPLDEAAMLRYLEALILLDDRTLALRRYGEFEKRLKEELEAEPGEGLRSWVKRERRGGGGWRSSMTRALRVAEQQALPAAKPVFGRDEEFAFLWEAWQRARGAAGQFVLVEGDAGIGKSALVAKLAYQVHVEGAAVCFVKCYRTEKAVPFAPVTALIRQLSRQPGFVAMSSVWLGELSRLVPDIRERYPDAPPGPAVGDSARQKLCDAVLDASQSVSLEQPLLIVVDDLLDADEPSIALVHYLGRQAASLSALVVCTTRGNCQETQVERDFLGSLHEGTLGSTMSLKPLSDDDIARVAKDVFAQHGVAAAQVLVPSVVQASRGNPLHAIEAAVTLASQSADSDARRVALPKMAVGFQETSFGRLTELAAHPRVVVNSLALAGRPLSDYELSIATALAPAELAAAVSVLVETHFARRSGGCLAVAHEQYVAAVDEQLDATERRLIHGRLARHFARSAVDDPAAHYQVAIHFKGAQALKEAVEHAEKAARFARSLGAVRERALALELLREAAGRASCTLVLELCASYLQLRDIDRVRSICGEYHESADHQEIRSDLEFFMLAADHHGGAVPVTELRERLATLVERALPFSRMPAARLLLMRIAEKTGAHTLVRRTGRELRRGELNSSSPVARAHALFGAAYVFTKYYKPARGLPLLRRAQAEAQLGQDWELDLLCRDGLGAVCKMVGLFEESASHISACIALARKTLNPQAEALALNNLAVTEMAMGRLATAEAHLDESARIDQRFPNWPYRSFRLLNQGAILLETGRLSSAETALTEGAVLAERQGFLHGLVMNGAMLALCAARQGNLAQLAHWAGLLGGMEEMWKAYSDRSMPEAALAWGLLLNERRSEDAVRRLELVASELRRRDVDHWLGAELELLRLREHIAGHAMPELRTKLSNQARSFGADFYALAVAS